MCRAPGSFVTEHFDTLETRDPEVRERALLAALPRQIAHAKANAPAFARILAGVDAAAVTSRAALARLPVTRKSELLELQKAARPFGGFAALARGARRARVFASPGPIYEPEGAAARLLASRARAVRRGLPRRRSRPQLLLLSLHAGRLDARDRRARARLHGVSRPAPGRPSSRCRRSPTSRRTATSARRRSCKIILDKADEQGIALPSLRKALVSGEAFPPSLRDALARARHRRLPGLRERRPRLDRLRDRGARGPRRRRGRAGRDRAAGHRRSGGAGRGRRGRRDDALQHRLSADPLRHRRSVRVPARAAAPAAAPTCASRAGWAAPTRRRR